jgi:hypothetical protein
MQTKPGANCLTWALMRLLDRNRFGKIVPVGLLSYTYGNLQKKELISYDGY